MKRHVEDVHAYDPPAGNMCPRTPGQNVHGGPVWTGNKNPPIKATAGEYL